MDLETINRHVHANYGLRVSSVRALPGYADQNYLLETEDRNKYVWKAAAPETSIESLQAQNEAMLHIRRTDSAFPCPSPIATIQGTHLVSRVVNGRLLQTRLLDWVEGTPLAKSNSGEHPLYQQIGQALGRMTQCLRDFVHVGAFRQIEWDLSQPLSLLCETTHIHNAQQKRIVDHLFLRLETHGVSRIAPLRRSVIHNDANDYNLLVSENQFSGLIDFGDLIYGVTASEIAVAGAYIMLDQPDPLGALQHLVRGYNDSWTLLPEERRALLDLIYARLAISLTNSARMATTHPNPDYLKISEAPIWRLLDRLLCISDDAFVRALDSACVPEAEPNTSKTLLQRRRDVLASNLSLQTQPAKYVVRGIGPYLYCADGSILLDLVNNVSHVGHTHPDVVRAATQQNSTLNTNSRFLHPYRSDYAKRLCDTLPEHLDTCFFVCTGSEANELALRLATTFTERKQVVVSDSAYHGHTSALIGLSPYKCNGPGGNGPDAHVHLITTPDPYRGPHQGSDSALNYLNDAEQIFKEHECAAVFMESLLGCGGQIVPPEGYLAGLFDLARTHGAIAIADEVQVGFGRIGPHYWAFEAQGARPDIVTMGKPIGNGHPMAAVVTTRAIADAFCNGMEYFNTFGGNPVSCAIGLAVLNVLRDENLPTHASIIGQHILTAVRDLAAQHQNIGDVRGMGLFIGIEIVNNKHHKVPNANVATQIKQALLARNILISIDGPDHNVLKIKPPMVLGMVDADRFLASFTDVMNSIVSPK